MARSPALPRLPFRNFLDHAEVTHFVERLAAARPELCRLESLGPSRQGRPIHLLTITDHNSGDASDRPAYLVHANIHASEVAGTHMALYTARQLLVEHPDLLGRVAFYIVPRLNPDGAEYAVATGGAIRSRNEDGERTPNTLYPEDVDGDGLILTMRQRHADGAFVRDPRDPRLMIRRQADSAGPYYRLLPEGQIEAWDGGEDIRERRRSFDWNRNWSYDWRPEPEQPGAGDFPFSEPEMRHMGEFVHSRPNLFGILGYHTGPAAVLRPPSTGADSDLDQQDVHAMEELARLGAQATGFPVVPVVEYHRSWERDNNLRGHFHNFGYHHLGLYVFEFELGTVRDSAGVDTEQQFGVFSEDEAEAQMRRVMRWWDRSQRQHPLFRPWRKFRHPQLGPVEIGGFIVCGLANQTLDRLRRIARGTHAFTLAHAHRHPHVVIDLVVIVVVVQGLELPGPLLHQGIGLVEPVAEDADDVLLDLGQESSVTGIEKPALDHQDRAVLGGDDVSAARLPGQHAHLAGGAARSQAGILDATRATDRQLAPEQDQHVQAGLAMGVDGGLGWDGPHAADS